MAPKADESAQESSMLLQLPDPCLLAVLQCCADDPRSLFSAARSHSRLHQAAVLALRSITAVLRHQQQVDSVVLYVSKYGQRTDSINLAGTNKDVTYILRQLPHNLQLSQLKFDRFCLQLGPGHGFRGVLGASMATAIKQLQLIDCWLHDSTDGLAAALSQLTSLEHLIVARKINDQGIYTCISTTVLQQLQRLTYLELVEVNLHGADHDPFDKDEPAADFLQPLTRLVGLRLAVAGLDITASNLSSACHLTRLGLTGCTFEPAALVGKTQIQHVELFSCCGGAEVNAPVVSHLQQLSQLTHLAVADSYGIMGYDAVPVASFSSLTASSRLQHLNISSYQLPASACQHMFPAGRQLPHLEHLHITCNDAPALECSRLVSCCPSLQYLGVQDFTQSAGLLVHLRGLSGLHTLHFSAGAGAVESWQAVCELTGLRELKLSVPDSAGWLLPQLTCVRQLTALTYNGPLNDKRTPISMMTKVRLHGLLHCCLQTDTVGHVGRCQSSMHVPRTL
jgi:hypothetical protein